MAQPHMHLLRHFRRGGLRKLVQSHECSSSISHTLQEREEPLSVVLLRMEYWGILHQAQLTGRVHQFHGLKMAQSSTMGHQCNTQQGMGVHLQR